MTKPLEVSFCHHLKKIIKRI